MLSDEDARLSQAGDRSEDRIRLADVFIDLPSSETQKSTPPNEDQPTLPPATLHELAFASGIKLDPYSIVEANGENSDGRKSNVISRFVILGGPGSGKSTLGQFLAQIHRMAILRKRPKHRLDTSISKIIDGIFKRCAEDNLPIPKVPRYPFRIDLNHFSKRLSLDHTSPDYVESLFEYIRREMGRDLGISHHDFREWMQKQPILLILDGLDEVPVSSNRREAMIAIQTFFTETADLNVDIFVIATSRPDGYSDEFGTVDVNQRHLLPLSAARALSCAGKYIESKKINKGESWADTTKGQIRDAISNPLIARLMGSPLQVTFMVTVVSASGRPSESRWQLFNDYYRTIYDRELHKSVPPYDGVLRTRRQDIDAIHHRAGFVLQCKAEASGGTDAELTSDELDAIVSACLIENGIEGGSLIHQKNMIIGASNQRLVFITSKRPSKWGFDVRSLQEYMAAACITTGDSSDIIPRIKAISHSAYWRNVVIFSIGRFFDDSNMRGSRDKIRIMCEDLNHSHHLCSTLSCGSRLALTVLQSKIIGDVPLFTVCLASQALQLLHCSAPPDFEVIYSLSQSYSDELLDTYSKAIDISIGQTDIHKSMPGWQLLLALEKSGHPWATRTINANFPTDPDSIFAIYHERFTATSRHFIQEFSIDDRDVGRLHALFGHIPFHRLISLILLVLHRQPQVNSDESTHLSWFEALLVIVESEATACDMKLNGSKLGSKLLIHKTTDVSFNKAIFSIAASLDGITALPEWNIFPQIANFSKQQSVESLGKVLSSFARYVNPGDYTRWCLYVHWPAAVFLRSANNQSELLQSAIMVEQYETETTAWINSQDDYESVGVALSDMTKPAYPGGPSLASGFIRLKGIQGSKPSIKLLIDLLNVSNASSTMKEREHLAWICDLHVSSSEGWTAVCPADPPIALLSSLTNPTFDSFRVGTINTPEQFDKWASFLSDVGKSKRINHRRTHLIPIESNREFICSAYKADPSRVGLLPFIAGFCLKTPPIPITSLDISYELIGDSPHILKSATILSLYLVCRDDTSAESISRLCGLLKRVSTLEKNDEFIRDCFYLLGLYGGTMNGNDQIIQAIEVMIPTTNHEQMNLLHAFKLSAWERQPNAFTKEMLECLRIPNSQES